MCNFNQITILSIYNNLSKTIQVRLITLSLNKDRIFSCKKNKHEIGNKTNKLATDFEPFRE